MIFYNSFFIFLRDGEQLVLNCGFPAERSLCCCSHFLSLWLYIWYQIIRQESSVFRPRYFITFYYNLLQG